MLVTVIGVIHESMITIIHTNLSDISHHDHLHL